MHKLAKICLSLLVISLALSLILAPAVFAKGMGGNNGKKPQLTSEERQAWEAQKNQLLSEKDGLEATKDTLEDQKDLLEADYEAALEIGDLATAAQLKLDIQATKQEIENLKQQMKQIKAEVKSTILSTYSEEELDTLDQVANELKKNKGIKVMPVQSIIAKDKSLKFDTPPVIKDGRTLIPLRALSTAFGCDVSWDATTKTITVIQDTNVLTLQIDSATVTVNGVAQQLDVSAEILNSRTVVPLRFIIENLGLQVDWDSESGTIEIEEPVVDENTGSTDDSAVVEETPEVTGEESEGTAEESTDTVDDQAPEAPVQEEPAV